MRLTMQFELPEQNNEYLQAINGPRYLEALCDFKLWMHDGLKHGRLDPAAATYADKAWRAFHDILTDLKLTIDDCA